MASYPPSRQLPVCALEHFPQYSLEPILGVRQRATRPAIRWLGQGRVLPLEDSWN